MIIETSREYFSIASFRHRTLKRFVAIWATLPRQLYCGGLKFENRLLFLHRHLSTSKWNFGGKTEEISDCRVCSFYRARVWHKVCLICLIVPTHEKKEHKQQQMWVKGLGIKYSIQQATIGNTILVQVGKMGGVKSPLTSFLSSSAGHDPLREALILFRAADHNSLQGSLILLRADTIP